MTIYAVQDPATLAVKFGYTKRARPGLRISALQNANPRKLVRLWYGVGEMADEAAVHTVLEPSRVKGEWFDYTDLVRLALVVLPIVGARGLIDLGRDGLLTFVPTSGRGMPNFWALAKGTGKTYWPDWSTSA